MFPNFDIFRGLININVLDLTVLHSYLNQINNKTLIPLFEYFFLFFLLLENPTNSNRNNHSWKSYLKNNRKWTSQKLEAIIPFLPDLVTFDNIYLLRYQALKCSSYTHTEKVANMSIMSLSLEFGEDIMASKDRGRQWMMMRGWDQSLGHWPQLTLHCVTQSPRRRLGRGGRHWRTAEAPLSPPRLGLSVYSH